MDYLHILLKPHVDTERVAEILEDSLRDTDALCRRDRQRLISAGLDRDSSLRLLAHHKSYRKYGFNLQPETLEQILCLGRINAKTSRLAELIEGPFLLAKCGWIFEHAPYFFFCGDKSLMQCNKLLLHFAATYWDDLLGKTRPLVYGAVSTPMRVLSTTFWDTRIVDPVRFVERTVEQNLEGFEFSVDYHPFNFCKTLPEELLPEKRKQLRDAARRSGVHIDIHSPIVGPYSPSADPQLGKQLFYDPTQCLPVQLETVDLARDINAESVVFHLIDTHAVEAYVSLIRRAAGTDVRVTIENYCQTRKRQTHCVLLDFAERVLARLTDAQRQRNFGLTLDVGHLNIEGEDPLVAAAGVGKWCMERGVQLRLHATDNYGNLLFTPPAFSADVHSSVSGRGIDNGLIIRMLRSMGHQISVVAEQIKPLSSDDIATIHNAQTKKITETFDDLVAAGKSSLKSAEHAMFLDHSVRREHSYQFLAGASGVSALEEHMVYRKIQGKKYLSVEEARRISAQFEKMPPNVRAGLTRYIDDLLLPVQTETGVQEKSSVDLICQNISSTIFSTIAEDDLAKIFAEEAGFERGTAICRQNYPGQEMYLVKEGSVAVDIGGTLVAVLGPGEIFGEISLFYNIERSATIRVETPFARLGILSRKKLESIFRQNEPHARELLRRFYRILPARLRNMNDKYKTAIHALHLFCGGTEAELSEFSKSLPLETNLVPPDYVPHLPETEISDIYDSVKEFATGEVIFQEGDAGDGIYFLLSGQVEVMSTNHNGSVVVLGELKSGELLGEMALVDGKPRSATAKALMPTRTGFLRKDQFDALIISQTDEAVRMTGLICLTLFRRILRLDSLYTGIRATIRQRELTSDQC